MKGACQLTGVSMIAFLCLFNAPADLLDVFADVIVSQFFLLGLLHCRSVFMPLLLDAVGYGLLDIGKYPMFNGSYGRTLISTFRCADWPFVTAILRLMGLQMLSNVPIRSVPAHLTRRKQKGKSRTLRARYTPTADHPYSRDSFRNLPLRDNDSSPPLAPPVCDLRDQDQLKFRFCVLESRRFGSDVPRCLHACEPRVNADGCACPAARAAAAPLFGECILLARTGEDVLAALKPEEDSLWKGAAFVEVVMVGRKGCHPGIEGRSARIMLRKRAQVSELTRICIARAKSKEFWEDGCRRCDPTPVGFKDFGLVILPAPETPARLVSDAGGRCCCRRSQSDMCWRNCVEL